MHLILVRCARYRALVVRVTYSCAILCCGCRKKEFINNTIKNYYIMKHLFTVLLILVCSGLMAQNNNNEEGVVKVENYASTYRPGEVIVKFKAQGNVQVRKNVQGKFQTAGVSSVDEVFANIGVENVEPLMPHTGKRISSKRMVAYNGD